MNRVTIHEMNGFKLRMICRMITGFGTYLQSIEVHLYTFTNRVTDKLMPMIYDVYQALWLTSNINF